MAPTTTTARATLRRLMPWRFAIALIACTFLWGVASVAALASGAPGQSQTTASSQKPADKAAAAPAQQKPKNRFGTVEEEEKPAPKPKTNRFGTVEEEEKPAPKPKTNRFGTVEEEEKPTPKPKTNRFGTVSQEPAPAPKPANRFGSVEEPTTAPKPANRFGSVNQEPAPAPKPRNRFANVDEPPSQKAAPAKAAAPAPKAPSKPVNRFATTDEPPAQTKPMTRPAAAQPAATEPPTTQSAPAAPTPAAAQPAPTTNRFATVAEEDQELKPVPAPTPAAQPAPKPKNRFATVEEEEEPQAKPAEAQAEQPKKNRFELEDEDIPEPPKEKVFTYTGTRKCSRCHMKQLNAYRNGPHGRHWDERTPAADLGCETCHGPGQAHDDFPAEKDLVRTFNRISPREASAFCLKCHDREKHAEWSSGLHEARNVTCINCHSIHQPKSEKGLLKDIDVVTTCAPCHRDKAAKIQRSSHMPLREGKMDCASCHNVHGSTNVRMLKTGSTLNESCLKCHAEKRGPFLWEHAPVVENCTTCHDPHGSWNDRMLVAKSAMLCERCHIGTRHPSTPYDGAALAARNNRLVNRGCVNCHSMIHGSNHPSGRFLAR